MEFVSNPIRATATLQVFGLLSNQSVHSLKLLIMLDTEKWPKVVGVKQRTISLDHFPIDLSKSRKLTNTIYNLLM